VEAIDMASLSTARCLCWRKKSQEFIVVTSVVNLSWTAQGLWSGWNARCELRGRSVSQCILGHIFIWCRCKQNDGSRL